MRRYLILIGLGLLVHATSCREDEPAPLPQPTTIEIAPGPDAEAEFRAAMDAHVPGNVIRFAPGEFVFHESVLTENLNNLRIEGAGPVMPPKI